MYWSHHVPDWATANRSDTNIVPQLYLYVFFFVTGLDQQIGPSDERDGQGRWFSRKMRMENQDELHFHIHKLDNVSFVATFVGGAADNLTDISRNGRFPEAKVYDNEGALYYVIVVIFIYGFSIILMIGSLIKKSDDTGVSKYMKEMERLRSVERRQQKFMTRMAMHHHMGSSRHKRTPSLIRNYGASTTGTKPDDLRDKSSDSGAEVLQNVYSGAKYAYDTQWGSPGRAHRMQYQDWQELCSSSCSLYNSRLDMEEGAVPGSPLPNTAWDPSSPLLIAAVSDCSDTTDMTTDAKSRSPVVPQRHVHVDMTSVGEDAPSSRQDLINMSVFDSTGSHSPALSVKDTAHNNTQPSLSSILEREEEVYV